MQPVSRESIRGGYSVHPFKVCVVDDCVDEAEILCEGLKLHDYTALPAHTGQECLRLCQEEEIHLVLLDVALPDISGYEVCKRLKENPRTRDISVIFVTAKGSPRDVTQAYELGALDFIMKPYNLPFIMVRVENAMRTLQGKTTSPGQHDSLPDLVYTDHLTGLRNRRYLMERLQEEAEKAQRHAYPLSCLFADVDDIVGLDSELGAASMDDVLVEIALALRNASRGYDILARFDGALFAAVLPHTCLEDAVRYAKKIQDEVDSMTFSEPSFPTSAKVSIGIVACQNGKVCSADEILGEAMRALLKAKSRPDDGIFAKHLSGSAQPSSTAI